MDIANQNELSVLTGFLGVPGYILSTFLPSIQQLASRQPRLVKALCIFVALTTFGFTLMEKIKRTLLSFLISYFMFSTTIDSNDPLYEYVIRWLQSRKKILPEQELQARSKEEVDRNSLLPRRQSQEQSDEQDVVYDFHGLQIFWHNWRPYFVSPYPQGRLGYPNYLTVRCFAFSSLGLRDIINEAWRVYRQDDQAHLTAVYRPVARNGGWKCVARRNRRSLDTIVLDPVEKEKLLDDVKFYLDGAAKEWYAARGIPYRRGYLFYGLPGTGKTSTSLAIAGQFGLQLYVISLLDPHINDTFLHTFFTNLPKGALILLEDIDSAGLARETFDKSLESYNRTRYRSHRQQPTTRVTLSGLLNAIDGADSPEGHLLIMTTNKPEALDEALIRPGRIDYKIGFKAVSPVQARAIFMRMYKGDVDEKVDLDALADSFSEKVPDDVFTPAELQGHLLRFKGEPARALNELDSWMQSVLDERKQLEEARQKEEQRQKRKEERRKAKRKALRGSLDGSDSDSDVSGFSFYSDALPPPNDYDYEPSYYSELDGDPRFADRDYSRGRYAGLDRASSPSPPRLIRRRSRHRSTKWDDLNGKERSCTVM